MLLFTLLLIALFFFSLLYLVEPEDADFVSLVPA